MDDVIFLVLAGGRGERLKFLTNTQPKPLVRFCISSRIIDFTLLNCLAHGEGDVVLLTQYLPDVIADYVKAGWRAPFFLQGRVLTTFDAKDSRKGGISKHR